MEVIERFLKIKNRPPFFFSLGEEKIINGN